MIKDAWLAALVALAAGCGSRPAAVQATTDGAVLAVEGGAGSARGAEQARDPSACVVAVRLDVCCPIPEPVPAASLGVADPCLVRYPYDFGVEPVPAVCAARRPRICDDGCGPLDKRPQSVFAALDAETGACVFANECEQDSDCTLASDRRQCCACPAAWPRRYVAEQPCLAEDAGAECLARACDPEPCPACSPYAAREAEAWCLKPPGIGPTQCALR